MAHKLRIFGPPGTGKTTELLGFVEGELDAGIRPEQIIYTSFTRAAASEARDRALTKFMDYHPDDFMWFSTIHSICFRLLGLGRDSVFAGKKLTEFCNIYGYEVSSNSGEEVFENELHPRVLETEVDYFEHFINWQRNLMFDFDTAYNMFTRQIDVPGGFNVEQLKAYISRRNEYKAKNSLWDFCDMIDVVVSEGLCPSNVKVMVSDEFQDLTPLLAKVTDLWSKKVDRYYFAGDPYQCLPEGTEVLTESGSKLIEQIDVGDKVICAIGQGYIQRGDVINCGSRWYSGDVIEIKTQGGKEVKVTPEHKLFWWWQTKGKTNYWYVYLMKMGDNYRIGKTNSPVVRLRFEHGAEGILPIMAFNSEQEALAHEIALSLNYGIPTTVFYTRLPGRTLPKEWQDWIFSQINSKLGATMLLQDLHKEWDGVVKPQPIGSSGEPRILVNVRPLFVHRGKHYQVVWYEHNGKRSPMKWLHSLTDARLFANEEAERIGGEIYEKWGFIKAHLSIPVPACNILPGCYLPVLNDGEIELDKIISVRRIKVKTKVYNIEVNPSNNYCAESIFIGNCIYSWMGADPNIFINAKADRTLVLKQSYRCPVAVHDLSRVIVNRFNTRYQDDDYIPKNVPGEILRAVPEIIDWDNLSGKIFYLHRTHWLLSQAFNSLLLDGIPFVTVKGRKSPLQTPKAAVVNTVFKLINLKYVTIEEVAKMMEYLPSKTAREIYLKQGAKTRCREMIKQKPYRNISYRDLPDLGFTNDFLAYFKPENILHPFKLSIDEKDYFTRVIQKYGASILESEPKVILSTLHGVKGRECDVSIINLNLTRKTYDGLMTNPDDEHRLFYVGVTRSRNKVVLLEPENYQSYRL